MMKCPPSTSSKDIGIAHIANDCNRATDPRYENWGLFSSKKQLSTYLMPNRLVHRTSLNATQETHGNETHTGCNQQGLTWFVFLIDQCEVLHDGARVGIRKLVHFRWIHVPAQHSHIWFPSCYWSLMLHARWKTHWCPQSQWDHNSLHMQAWDSIQALLSAASENQHILPDMRD